MEERGTMAAATVTAARMAVDGIMAMGLKTVARMAADGTMATGLKVVARTGLHGIVELLAQAARTVDGTTTTTTTRSKGAKLHLLLSGERKRRTVGRCRGRRESG